MKIAAPQAIRAAVLALTCPPPIADAAAELISRLCFGSAE
jgi:hypothetical protein